MQNANKTLFWVVAVLRAEDGPDGAIRQYCDALLTTGDRTHPKIKSGWDMKSVMRSSILLGSRTNVGKVTL